MEKVIHKYSPEEDKFILENVKGITLKELTKRFNKKFKVNVKEESISNRKTRIGAKSGIVGGRFEKGHVPANKGKKGSMTKEQYEKCKKTMFKKGHIPANRKPIGSERYNNRDGILVKVQDGHLQKNWMPKSRYIYEQKYGKIPAGHKVIFADGNKLNFDIDNLILVSDSEELIMNRRNLIKEDRETTKTGALIAKVIDKTNKVKRKGKKNGK